MTIDKKDLEVSNKQEIEQPQEQTTAGKRYLPATDIVETDGELLLYMDMPGVEKDQIQVKLEKNVLLIDGQIDSKPYADLKPLYTEYNIGNFTRRFELSNTVDQANIGASVKDGVLILRLPKVPEKQPRMIEVN
jgi:HSP20 family protein